MSSKSIRISPKHGVNPTIPVCFFCGKEKNEIALLGKIDKEDSEAPRKMVLNYEPCEECKKRFAEGVLIIEIMSYANDMRPPITEGAYPTGAHAVVNPEALNPPFNKAGTKCLMWRDEFQSMFKNTTQGE